MRAMPAQTLWLAMKAKQGSALRERGLRRVCGAEPPIEAVTQLTDPHPNNREPPSNIERKTDTMKTYILRDPSTVEAQNPPRLRRDDPALHALVGKILAAGRGPALYLGLDVHNDSIAVSLAPSDATEVRSYGLIGGAHDDVLKLLKKL